MARPARLAISYGQQVLDLPASCWPILCTLPENGSERNFHWPIALMAVPFETRQVLQGKAIEDNSVDASQSPFMAPAVGREFMVQILRTRECRARHCDFQNLAVTSTPEARSDNRKYVWVARPSISTSTMKSQD